MNVSMIVLNPFTNDARVMKEAQTLASHHHAVTVNALWAPGLPVDEMIGKIRVHRVRIRAREGIHVPLAAWVELVPKFVREVLHQRPDVCHAHDLNALIPGHLAARAARARLIYDSHELQTDRASSQGSDGRLKRTAWKGVESWLIRRADAVITVSDAIADTLVSRYGIDRPLVVLNCPDWQELPPPGGLRHQLGLQDEQKIVLYQGAVVRGRGLEPVLHAVAMVPEATLVVLGDGPFRSSIETMAAELGIAERVRLPGKVPLDRLLAYTQDASIGTCLIQNTCLSYYYSLPNKLFEYMMASVPVVASNFPEMQRVVNGTGAGMTVDPENVQAIAGTLRHMLAHPQELERMSLHARSAARDQYNWGFQAKALLSLYDQLAGD